MQKHSTFLLIFPVVVILFAGYACLPLHDSGATEYYVSPQGSDGNYGTLDSPFKTIIRAQNAIRDTGIAGKQSVTVNLRGGTYYLDDTIKFLPGDSGSENAPVIYQAYNNEKVVISGGERLDVKWTSHSKGILKTPVAEDLTSEELFVNGKRRYLARYPNFDSRARFFNGVAADSISQENVDKWENPAGGYIHALHNKLWGSQHYLITGKNEDGELTYEGGWQHHWSKSMHRVFRFVENVFEELDAPDEWYLDQKNSVLYYYPPEGLDIDQAKIEVVRLERLFEFAGSEKSPVRFITLRGLTLTHTARTFMKTKEPLNRSDWMICRSGAVFMNGTEECAIEDCTFDQVGGNAVFVNHYNFRTVISGCHIYGAGASGVAFVGDSTAVRKGGWKSTLEEVDREKGPENNNYPRDCFIEDCLMHDLGRFEKQVAGVQISMAQNIRVRHCSIYTMPRAGINISDGCWGGHIIEYCDVFDTVRETSDHGAFNCWGRDRYHRLKGLDPHSISTGQYKDFPRLDAVKPVTIRNSRWQCSHGWDIDLDDGSVAYYVYNNLCLEGGIKFREGFFRSCVNNVMVNNSLHPHVWYRNSDDVVQRNIVFRPYRPIGMKGWGKEFDYNLYHDPAVTNQSASVLQQQSGMDRNSIRADAMFVDPLSMDYRVKEGSPALKLGFMNFPMDKFGVTSARLKKLARTPVAPHIEQKETAKDVLPFAWKGLVMRELEEGEYSAWGASKEAGGLHVFNIRKASVAGQAGIEKDDLILSIDEISIRNRADVDKLKPTGPYKVTCIKAGTGKTIMVQVP